MNTYNEIIKESLDSQSIYITISNKFDNPSQIILEKLSEKTQEDFFYCDSKQTSPHYLGKNVLMEEKTDFSYKLTNFALVSCPTSLVYLNFSLSTRLPKHNLSFSLNNSLNEYSSNDEYFIFIPIKILECQIGEFYDPSRFFCQKCLFGQYSIKSKTWSCEYCPQEAICNGGDDFKLKNNFWSMNNSILEEIYPCNIFSEGCLGIKCNDGYEGILCSNCKDGSNSYKNILGECHDCPEKHFTLLNVSLVSIIFIFLIMKIMLIFENINTSEARKFVIKVMVNFIHLMIYVKDQYSKLEYVSDNLEDLIRKTKVIFESEYLYINFDCVFLFFNTDNPLYKTLVLILITYVIIFTFYCYFRIIKKMPSKKIFNRLFLVFYIIFPILIFEIKKCLSFKNINGVTRLAHNLNFIVNDIPNPVFILIYLNLLFLFFVLFVVNILFLMRLPKNIEAAKIAKTGLSNPVIYETCNLFSMVFFFLIGLFDFSIMIEISIICFLHLYRIFIEFSFCNFNGETFKNINFSVKLYFICHFLVFYCLTIETSKVIVIIFLMIKYVLLFNLFGYLLVLFVGVRRYHKLQSRNLSKRKIKKPYFKNK